MMLSLTRSAIQHHFELTVFYLTVGCIK